MKKYLPIIILISVFLIFKITNLGVRLSDSNIYFFTGYQLLQGQILYKDIFFTNFPLIPYLSAIYFMLTAGSLKLFFLTSILEAGIVSFLIYKIIYKEQKDSFLAGLSALIYLFSFIILSTSDHQSGVFLASIFSVLSYYFYLNKMYLLTGVFVAFAILTKAYFLPILLTFFAVFMIDKKWKSISRFMIGGIIASVIIMFPTLLLAFPEFIKNVLEYSLTRSQGVGKSNIIWFFITHDFILFVLFLFSLININKNKFLGLLSSFGLLFLIFYQDVYYLYLNFLVPFLVLSFPEFYKALQNNFNIQKAVLLTILLPFIFYGFFVYLANFANLQKLDNYNEVVRAIKNENPDVLYGVNDIAPALSYSTGIPLLNGIIDTNSNIFRKGILDSKKLTKEAVSRKSIIVSHGLDYPQSGISEQITDEIFDKAQIEASCRLIKSFPVQTEGVENRLNLLRCY